jgi:uncharacterized membrane protein YgdD (TMEM256/DUF423 family)
VTTFAVGAFMAALGVGLGAFGAHVLGDVGPARMAWWTTATHYWFVAALAVMAWAALLRGSRVPVGPSATLIVGATIFSGTLYAMALGAPRWLGAITPVGGVALIAGFAWMALRTFQAR